MSPNPILKVLSTFLKCEVQALLMGGQACILYGAAEFSRDTDFAVLCSPPNLEKLRKALLDLAAEPVFLPPLEAGYLERGHACHFRCGREEAAGLRVDVMSVMRGCDPFPILWERREIADLPEVGAVPLLSLPDLVVAKKTQREKDWPMIQRLVEADYARKGGSSKAPDVRFWLREGRSTELLRDVAERYDDLAREESSGRPWLQALNTLSDQELLEALHRERERERQLDRAYWQPLRAELEALRRARRAPGG